MSQLLDRLGRAAVRHRRLVVLLWIVAPPDTPRRCGEGRELEAAHRIDGSTTRIRWPAVRRPQRSQIAPDRMSR